MPQPAEVTSAAEAMVALFQASQDRILAEQARIATAPNRALRRQRLDELTRIVGLEMNRLNAASESFFKETLPAIYARGGLDSQLLTEWTWSQVHRQAVEALAADGFEAVLEATRFVNADTKRWVRETSHALTSAAVIEGRTPQEVARELRRLAPRAWGPNGEPLPLRAITYRNGTRMPLAPYSSMLMRTQTALAYNEGTLNTVTEAGVSYVEILDGTDCGLTEHDDPEKANGKIMLASKARQYPIAHPQCRRSFAPRPELTNANEARNARRRQRGSVVDPASQADQTRFERAQADLVRQRAARRRARSRPSGPTRPARLPRATQPTTRTPRAQKAARPPREPRKPEPVARPGDRFRGRGDWTEEIADDLDRVAASNRTDWKRVQLRGNRELPSDELLDAQAAMTRVGNAVNREVRRRMTDAGDVPAIKSQIRQLAERRLAASQRASDLTSAVQSVDRLVLNLADLDSDEFFDLLRVVSQAENPGGDGFVNWLQWNNAREALVDFGIDWDRLLSGAFTRDEVLDTIRILADDIGDGVKNLQRTVAELNERRLALKASLPDIRQTQLEVLSEIRDFGGDVNIRFGTGLTERRGQRLVAEHVREAQRYIPTEWIDELNAATATRGQDPVDFFGNLLGQAQREGRSDIVDEIRRVFGELPSSSSNDDIWAAFERSTVSFERPTGGIEMVVDGNRGYAIQQLDRINVTTSPSTRLMTHEIQHLVDEHRDGFGSQAWGHITRRADDGISTEALRDPGTLRNARLRSGGVDESYGYVTEANYADDYTGRVYDAGGPNVNTYEVHTTGVEGYWGEGVVRVRYMQPRSGRVGGPVDFDGNPVDEDFLDYIAGLLAVG